ncbi:hypothetical protein NXX39_17870 [Bacteroides ovatus]|uniref:hypothetical protein n=1 Tax=Bacteroides ovatus TaxID=28116 RepID=UPI001CCDB8AB|nr:hypothetical protein [Bacteroides ovatus]MCS2474972.1 hypothetical protein [Bacteroides ovatus]MCS3099351.1 hypothetical protein [Bacteroides ovatus]UBF10928.1 hypothetical protein K6V23_27630 [Bacteroides ovatus]
MELSKETAILLRNVKIDNLNTLQEIEELCKDIDDINIIEPLFRVFENNPDFDFGNPGNLVRIIERYYTNPLYEQELYKSVERKPTAYNLWLLNRLMNTFEEEQKRRGIELLEKVVNTPNTSEDVQEWAKEFLEEQT